MLVYVEIFWFDIVTQCWVDNIISYLICTLHRVLPDIDLYIEEFTELQHNKLNGIYKGGGGGVMTASECDAGNDSLQSLNNAINQSSHSTHTNKTNFSTGTTTDTTTSVMTNNLLYCHVFININIHLL